MYSPVPIPVPTTPPTNRPTCPASRFRLAQEGQGDIDHDADEDRIADGAEPGPLAERDPKQENQEAHSDHYPAKRDADAPGKPLMKHIPGAETETGRHDHSAAHAEQDEAQIEIEEPASQPPAGGQRLHESLNL